MANAKISALTALTTATTDDIFPVVDDPAGSPVTKKITLANLLTSLGTLGKFPFPATQVASAGANDLDDYEEGTWTPVVTFATPGNLSVSYVDQTGRYTKIGRTVFYSCSVSTSAFTHTTASGNFNVTGLPFTAATVTNHAWHAPLRTEGWTLAGSFICAARVSSNTSFIDIIYDQTAGTVGAFTTVHYTTGATVRIYATGYYEV